MNTKILIGAAVTLVVGMATASAVRAFDVAGTLGVSQNAVDVFTINCLSGINGTNNAKAWVWDVGTVNTPAKMRVFLVEFPNTPSIPAEDATPAGTGEGGGSSPETRRGDGAGLYQVHFFKTASGAESYTGRIRCLNASGGDVAGVVAPQQTQFQ